MRKLYLAVLIVSIFISVASASFPIFVTPLDGSGNIQPSTAFEYQWNFTTNANCSNVVLSSTETIITDKYGRGFVNISLDDLTGIPSYVCEYKNGTLRKTFQVSQQTFADVYFESINVTNNLYVGGNANFVGNLTNTDSHFLGFVDYLKIINNPSDVFTWATLWSQIYNKTKVDAINTSMKNYGDSTFATITNLAAKVSWTELMGLIFQEAIL